MRLRAIEEDLGKFRVTRHLLDRDDLDSGLIHRHKQIADATMPLGLRIGAAEDKAPLGPMREARPNLLSFDDPLIADEPRLRLNICEIRARIRLGIALAPELIARDDRRKKTL